MQTTMSKSNQGWQCPGCGINYAPIVQSCECTKHAPVQVAPYYPYYPYPYTPYPYYPHWYHGQTWTDTTKVTFDATPNNASAGLLWEGAGDSANYEVVTATQPLTWNGTTTTFDVRLGN